MRIPFTDLSARPATQDRSTSDPFLPAPVVFAVLVMICTCAAIWAAATYYSPFSAGLHEDGPVEKMSAALWGLCAVMVIYFSRSRVLGPQWQVWALFIVLCSRELDFDKRFLSEGILQLRLYTGDAAIWEKAVGLTVVLLVLTILFRLLRLNVPGFMSGLRHFRPWAWCGASAVGFVVVAKTIDGIGRKLGEFGLTLDPEVIETAMIYEELLELLAAALIAWSICLLETQLRRARVG